MKKNTNVQIKRFDNTLPLPEYKTTGAAGFDLSARERSVVAPHAVAYVPLNVAILPPQGYFVLLAARSSLHKKGLIPANGVGIIDRDYSGDSDEYIAALYNFSDVEAVIERGERIMQGILLSTQQCVWSEVDIMGKEPRGGFGSTGSR